MYGVSAKEDHAVIHAIHANKLGEIGYRKMNSALNKLSNIRRTPTDKGQ